LELVRVKRSRLSSYLFRKKGRKGGREGGREGDSIPVFTPGPFRVCVFGPRNGQHALVELLVFTEVEGIEQPFQGGGLT
jgi:hypothetical protein